MRLEEVGRVSLPSQEPSKKVLSQSEQGNVIPITPLENDQKGSSDSQKQPRFSQVFDLIEKAKKRGLKNNQIHTQRMQAKALRAYAKAGPSDKTEAPGQEVNIKV
ncbi:MAG: hypothetical protein IT289_04160 [Oligoflexia bacterium]|nr:hypothetical protein [Oligoflexia bacterium]